MIIEKEEIVEGQKNITMNYILRKIKAENKEAAIGKFVLNTESVKAIKKLNIDCYDLSEFELL